MAHRPRPPPRAVKPDPIDTVIALLLARQEKESMTQTQPHARPTPAKPPNSGWLCRWNDCPAAEKYKVTFASKPCCCGCGRAKNKALSPPVASRVPPREPTQRRKPATTDQDKPKHKDYAAAVRNGGPKAAPIATTPAAAEVQKDEVEAGPVGVLFNKLESIKAPKDGIITGTDEATRLGLAALTPIDTSRLYRLPPSELPAFSIEAELGKVAPVEITEAIRAKEQYRAFTLQAATVLPDGHDSKLGLMDKVKEADAAIAKLKKKAPGDTLMIEQLRSAQQGYRQHAAQLEQNAKEGETKALKQLSEQTKLIDKMVADLTKLKNNVIASHGAATVAWKDYHARRDKQWHDILGEFDTRIAQLQAQPVVAGIVTAPPDPMAVDAIAALTPLQIAEADSRATKAKMEAMLAAHAQRERDMAAATAVLHDHLATFTCEAADFPVQVAEPGESQWQEVHNLWAGLEAMQQQEAFQGAQAPVTYGELLSGTAVPRLLLGETLWQKAYPARQPDDSTVVTVQLRYFLWRSLQAHRDKLLGDKQRQEQAKASLGSAVQDVVTAFRQKRRRAEEVIAVPASG